jgi:putative transposase
VKQSGDSNSPERRLSSRRGTSLPTDTLSSNQATPAAGKPPLLPAGHAKPTDRLTFLNPFAPVQHTRNRLPHQQQEGATYFVTFRLADSLPDELMKRWSAERAAWLRHNPQPWSAAQEREHDRRFLLQLEQWLDEHHGSCVLRTPEYRRIIEAALLHFEGTRSEFHASVVMPNHVHALFSAKPDWTLDELLQSWKGFTSRRINEHLGERGERWQRDYFDRLIRDDDHFWRCVRYIQRNPPRAELSPEACGLFLSPFVREVLGPTLSLDAEFRPERRLSSRREMPAESDSPIPSSPLPAAGKPPLRHDFP